MPHIRSLPDDLEGGDHRPAIAVTIRVMADIPPPPPGTPPYQPPTSPSYSDVPPGAPGYGMPPGAPGYGMPPGAPGYTPPAGYPNVRPAGVSIMSQFTGIAMWSIILGLISIGVPLVTGLMSNSGTYYFYILPIFGFIRGVQALTKGQVIGGVTGIVLNILGGFMSLIASGVLFG